MKKIFSNIFLLSLAFSSGTCYAQFLQTDEFNYWEDQSSHSYFTTGISFAGVYNCPGDLSLRCGNCGAGLGLVSVMLAVTPNCDSIRIDYQLGWGSDAVLRVDGVSITTIGISSPNSCMWQSVIIPNANAYTSDGFVNLVIEDTILNCTGDFQIAHAIIFSTPVITTGIFSSPEFSDDEFSVVPNPSGGVFKIDFKNDFANVGAISVYNAEGEIVFYNSPESGSRSKRFEIDLRNKAAGIYFLRVVKDSGVRVRKIVLQ